MPQGARVAGMAAVGGEAALTALPPMIAELCRLHTQLTVRGVPWEAAFAPYDASRSGVVSMSDLLRVFRESGLSPQPSLLRELPNHTLTARGVWYAALQELVPTDEPDAPLISAHNHAVLTPRRHFQPACGVPDSHLISATNEAVYTPRRHFQAPSTGRPF